MKRKWLFLALSILLIGVVGMISVQAYRNRQRIAPRPVEIAGDQPVQLPDESVRIAVADDKLSGPYMYNNLTIYLVHGQDRGGAKPPLTLSEAMEQKKVVVHETESVNELAVENVSNEQVFVQSGDIVKGGKQDRVLAVDMIIPPKSGKMPIDSFCVEHGRWSGRGDEAVASFGGSTKMINSKELKIAAKHNGSQREVWDKVAESQVKLSRGVVANATPASSGAAGLAEPNFSVNSRESESSLQLALENKELQRSVKDYIEKLSPIIQGKEDAIGYVFAINGELNSADIYSTHQLFVKLWPKLLEASATEAIGEYDKDKLNRPVEIAAVKAFLAEAETATSSTRDLDGRMLLIKRESEKKLFFETRQGKQTTDWVHRNYIAK